MRSSSLQMTRKDPGAWENGGENGLRNSLPSNGRLLKPSGSAALSSAGRALPNSLLSDKSFPASLRNGPELAAFLALAGSVSLVLVSIAASQILLAAAVVGYLWMLKRRDGAVPPGGKILWPLLALSLWMVVAAFVSADPLLSLKITKKFFLFLLVPVVPLVLRGGKGISWIYKAVFALATVSSLGGLAQFAADPHRDLLHRISGFMSQWMTYSGLLMLALVLLSSYALVWGIRRNKWIIPVALLVALALFFCQTRNAWIGAIAGMAVLMLTWRPRALVVLVIGIAVLYALSPRVRSRVQAGMDPHDPNTRNRIELVQTSLRLIGDNPWFGVGPKLVNSEALKYRGDLILEFRFASDIRPPARAFETSARNEYPDWMYQHMHNNFLQIAAETGIPGLLIWLWFMGRLAWDAFGLYRRARKGSALSGDTRKKALMASSAALASWTALMLAGLFEYNFGDSEVLTLFLFIVSAPYAFHASGADARS